MDVDWDFFLGMLAAFMLWFSWSRYKSGPKRAAMARHPSNYNLKHDGCPTRWTNIEGCKIEGCKINKGGQHVCFWYNVHQGNHTCICGEEIPGLWKIK